MSDQPPEISELERTAEWRKRRQDADPDDTANAKAIQLIETLLADLRQPRQEALWTELRSLTNWLAESDAISDYAALKTDYHANIAVSHHPADAAAYLLGLLAIARSLV